jgi:Na+/melibiose symporter-like transporter
VALPPIDNETVEAVQAARDDIPRKELRGGWRLSRGERVRYYLGYSGWQTGSGILASFLTIFLMLQGMSLAAVGTLILIVKLIDAADDLLFGYVIDRINPTKMKWLGRLAGTGKYLPWYRVTFALLPLATIIFFAMPSGLPEYAKIAWFAIAYLLYDVATTLSQVPMSSMIMTLTDDVTERNALLKVKGVLMVVFAVVAGLAWQAMISEFVGWPVAAVAIGSAIVAFLLMLPLARKVQEHNVGLKNVAEEAAPRYTVGEMFRALRTNKYMLLLLSADVVRGLGLTQLTTGMFAAFFLFNNSLILTLPVLVAFVPGLILQFFADRIVRRFGKRNTLLAAALLATITGVVMFLLGPSNVTVVVALMAIMSIPGALIVVVMTFVVPDTIEYTRYKTGQDCSGIFYALESFVHKASAGVSAAFAMFVLALGGWVAVNATDFSDLAAQGMEQPPSALTALWLTISLLPALGCLAFGVMMAFYRLRDRDASLMAQCNSGEISREECEAQLSRRY